MPSQLLPLDLPPELMLGRIADLKTTLANSDGEPCVIHLGGGATLDSSHALHLAELIGCAVRRGRTIIGDAVSPLYATGALVWLACPVRTMYPSGYLYLDGPRAIGAGLRESGLGTVAAIEVHGPARQGWVDYLECMRRVIQIVEEPDIFDRRIDTKTLQRLGLIYTPDRLLELQDDLGHEPSGPGVQEL